MPEPVTAETKEQMGYFIDLQIEEVAGHLTIIDVNNTENAVYWPAGPTPGKLPMYRIDKQMPEKLYPNMPKSAMANENNTIPRITCAPSLIGCIVGYYRAEQDLLDAGRFGKDVKKQYVGGYTISTIEPSLVLKPDATLVPDQGRSDEHWVVPFNEDHVDFAPRQIGKCFIHRLTHVNSGGQNKPPVLEIEMFIQMDEPHFAVAPGRVITKGYWKMFLRWESLFARDVRKSNDALVSLTEINQEEFMVAKGFSANLLSDDTPAFKRW